MVSLRDRARRKNLRKGTLGGTHRKPLRFYRVADSTKSINQIRLVSWSIREPAQAGFRISGTQRMTSLTAPKLKGARCQCSTCGLVFGGESIFDRHRKGRFDVSPPHPEARRCLTPAELGADGMFPDDYGVWRRPRKVPGSVSTKISALEA